MKSYTAPHDVFLDRYYKAGEVFTTDAKKGEQWEEASGKADASQKHPVKASGKAD